MRAVAAFLILAAAAAASPSSAAPVSERAFAAEMVERLERARPDASFAARPDEPLVIIAKGWSDEEAQLNLHRIYGYCAQAAAEECETSKEDYVRKLAAPVAKPSATALRLIVRDSEYLASASEMNPIAKPIGEDLTALLAIDSPDQIMIVGEAVLKELGLGRDEAWALAQRQTAALLPAIPKAEQLSTSAMAYEGEEYLGSLLIDLPAWARLSEKVGPELFVTAVADQFVFVGKISDGKNLEGFGKSVAEDCAARPRCISPNIYRFRDGRWVVARPAVP